MPQENRTEGNTGMPYGHINLPIVRSGEISGWRLPARGAVFSADVLSTNQLKNKHGLAKNCLGSVLVFVRTRSTLSKCGEEILGGIFQGGLDVAPGLC